MMHLMQPLISSGAGGWREVLKSLTEMVAWDGGPEWTVALSGIVFI